MSDHPDRPYLLLTPGPASTSNGVREAMLTDWCTWDADYNALTETIRRRLVMLAAVSDRFTSVLMQGSGTFGVESVVGSVIPSGGKLLTVDNGAYGRRIGAIAKRLGIDTVVLQQDECQPANVREVGRILADDDAITHVAMVHCETTTGMLNPIGEVGQLAAQRGLTYIVDAMSSFGGVPMTIEGVQAHYLIASANKCIQGVPGFSFVIADRQALQQTAGWARSLSLDLYDQWREMEDHAGKWRFTSPTHVVHAFTQALDELLAEGGINARYRRYRENQERLAAGMRQLGFKPLLPAAWQSPIITAFRYPDCPGFSFPALYSGLKRRGFVIYPGKVSQTETFRIGTIGHVFPPDIDALLVAVGATVDEHDWDLSRTEASDG